MKANVFSEEHIKSKAEEMIAEGIKMLQANGLINYDYHLQNALKKVVGPCRVFAVTGKECTDALEFIDQERRKDLEEQIKKGLVPPDALAPYHGAIGGAVRYSFVPTTVAHHVFVSYLGHEKDVSDYQTW